MRSRLCRLVVIFAGSLVTSACDRAKTATTPSSPDAQAGPPSAGVASVPSAVASAPSSAARGACRLDRAAAVTLPSSSRATEIRIAALGGKALVTWTEPMRGPDTVERVIGHVFDSATKSIGARIEIDSTSYADSPISGAAPIASGPDLVAVTCFYGAPSGTYSCSKRVPGAKPTELFGFTGIAVGGPQHPGIAAVPKGDDVVVFVPDMTGAGLHLFSTRVKAKKGTHPFPIPGEKAAKADGLGAVLSLPEEVTVVYRFGSAIKARRATFDQTWTGKAVDLAQRGTLVGSPVVALDGASGSKIVALFSQRAKTTDPWRIMLSEWLGAAEPIRAELGTGTLEAQAPGIAAAGRPGCFHVSWVEGSGKTTKTKLAQACDGAIAPESIVPLSSDGIEGGRAYLAVDPRTAATELFVVWQELPAGKPAELSIAKVDCR